MMTLKFLVSASLIFGAISARAALPPANSYPSDTANSAVEDENNHFVEHLNTYYRHLKVKVIKDADPDQANRELYQLQDALGGLIDIPKKLLKNLSCSSAPCGGCTAGPC